MLFPPIETSAKAPREANGRRRAGRMPALRGRVVMADDEVVVRDLMHDLLTGWGLEVALAPTGVEAAAAFAAEPLRFDLVLTDQTMPRMTGLALSREVTRLRPGIPVLLCPGFGDDLSKRDIETAGICAVARKPIEPAALYTLLKRHLGAAARTSPPAGSKGRAAARRPANRAGLGDRT